jgi:hypothetical protein
MKNVIALAHELGQSARRFGASFYQYGDSRLWWQACLAGADYLWHRYRVMARYYALMTDLERLYYAEGGFLVTIPKPTSRTLTDCTTIVPGIPNRVQR